MDNQDFATTKVAQDNSPTASAPSEEAAGLLPSGKVLTPVEPIGNTQRGLTAAEVESRVAAGLVNGKYEVRTKNYWEIFRTNTFTLFNLLNLTLALLVVFLGHSPKNVGFVLPAVINWIIGMVQEVRAKRTIDKLSLLSAPKVCVVRDETEIDVQIAEVVMDDLMVLSSGDQICADCVLIEGSCEVNESLITGESDPVAKHQGDTLLSGSFLVSGKAEARVVHIGMENYVNKISSGAKYIKSTNSEILRALRTVIKLMSIVVVPLGILLFLKQYLLQHNPLDQSVVSMVSSMSGMIPQGLMALSSAVFAIGIIRLSRHNTLAQDLYCIETLARVDVLCLDKTGTITEGSMQVKKVLTVVDNSEERVQRILSTMVDILPDSNPTYNAVKEYCVGKPRDPEAQPVYVVPFNSARKWSGISLAGGSYIMGAAEFVFPDRTEEMQALLDGYSRDGYRVLVLATAPAVMNGPELPQGLSMMAYILISDKIRAEAPDTLRFFAEEDVDIRIISGDNPVTVSAIAREAGLKQCEYVDMSTIETEEQLVEASRKYKVFGRVTPEQKLKLVKALKADGHTVAMTGDGVNDVLALKEADCSIAMAAGSDAARNVAQLVLLDSNFASMPRIVAEGRRSINNLQRSAALYLVKTMYMALLTILFLIVGDYPFEPNHITLIGIATIGIPSFFLALESNHERVQGHFLQNAITKSAPGAVTIVFAFAFLQLLLHVMPERFALTDDQVSTVSVLLLVGNGFFVLFNVCRPFTAGHFVLYVGMWLIFALGWLLCSIPWDFHIMGRTLNLRDLNWFSMTPMGEMTGNIWLYSGVTLGFSMFVFTLLTYLAHQFNLFSAKRMMRALRLEDKA